MPAEREVAWHKRVKTHVGPVCVGAVFLAAGVLKIWDPPAFALAVARLQVLPRGLIGPTAILLPWIELAAGAALLSPWRAAGRALAAVLLAAFSAVLAAALWRGTSTSCGCFGGEGRLDVALLRNVLLGLLLALGYAPRRVRGSPSSVISRQQGSPRPPPRGEAGTSSED